MNQLINTGTKKYRERKFWLSVCQVYEWEAAEDELCNTYFRNNVSGETQWTIPEEVNRLGDCMALETLELSENVIKAFAPSLVAITTLTRLCGFDNKLKELPARFGELVNLTHLDLHNNDLRLLPRTYT